MEEKSETDLMERFVTEELLSASEPPVEDSESCVICMTSLKEPGMYEEEQNRERLKLGFLNICHHRFHGSCVEALCSHSTSHVQCPVCKLIYGVKVGTQPKNGKMEVYKTSGKLPGYEQDPECKGIIQIVYSFSRGIQEKGNPHPGQPYNITAFPRHAFLPDTPKGNIVLGLLQRAFRQRVTFTVGRSSTSGLEDVITWNDIHHKTGHHGTYGYPDKHYLDNVMLELAQHGILEEVEEKEREERNRKEKQKKEGEKKKRKEEYQMENATDRLDLNEPKVPGQDKIGEENTEAMDCATGKEGGAMESEVQDKDNVSPKEHPVITID